MTWTRPTLCFGTSSRSSRDRGAISSSDSPSRSHCEPSELSALLPLVLLRVPPVPPMVTSAEPFWLDRGPLEPAAVLEGQADFQMSRMRGPYILC